MTALFRGKLARSSALLFAGTLGAGVLGFAFHVLMGRMLSLAEYGLFSAAMALFLVFSAPLNTLMMVVARKVSEYRARGDDGGISRFFYAVNARSAVGGVLVLGLCSVLGRRVQAYLGAPTLLPVGLLAALLLLTVPSVLNNAFLQGLQDFSWLSLSGFLLILFKIVFSAALVRAGYGVGGALGGAVLAAAAVWLLTYGALRRPLSRGSATGPGKVRLPFDSFLSAFVANAAFAVMTQMDVVMVNHYFPAGEAGLYAAASILGKAVLYLPAGVALALFPMVAESHARDEDSAHLLTQALVLTAILCGAAAVFYLFFGNAVIMLLYGENYRGAGDVLRLYGFAILPMAFLQVAQNFLIAKGRRFFACLFAVAAPLELLAVHLCHGSLRQVVVVIGASGAVLSVLVCGPLWEAFRRKRDPLSIPLKTVRIKNLLPASGEPPPS